MTHQEILVKTHDLIIMFTLNRPQHPSAWTDVMAEKVLAAMSAAAAEDDVYLKLYGDLL
jgi:enoyl-CoA hydratase/carnithine racemase